MTDSIVVQEEQTVVSVRDSDNVPVTITNQTVGVSGGDDAVVVEQVEGSKVYIQDGDSRLVIEDKQQVIQPKFAEVIKINQIISGSEEEEMYKEEVDFVGEDLIYRGWAQPGSATSSGVWRIRRTRFVGADDDVIHDWADGNTNFDNVWDDRASLTYN